MWVMDYPQSQGDHMLFIKHLDTSEVIILVVYIDDIIVIERDETEISKLSQHLAQEFEIKTLWRLTYFLVIKLSIQK